jgi:heme oxygenase
MSAPIRQSSLRQALKRCTAASHRGLEARLGLLEPDLDVRGYRRVLELFYGFYVPLERALMPRSGQIPFPLRVRAVPLAEDLSSLGLSQDEVAALPACTALPGLTCSEDLAGCVYVLEGASLGGQVITRLVGKRLGVAKGAGASFFAGDDDVAARWAAVLVWLEELAHAGVPEGPIVAAANATFDALVRWVDRQEPSWSRRKSWAI